MFRFRGPSAVFVATVLTATQAPAATGPTPPAKAEEGMLVGKDRMTLYTFENDPAGAGQSACNGPCAQNWPPLQATETSRASGDYTIVSRDDGTRQWAYKGRPLYYWAKDEKPGDTTGDGVKGVWHVARP